MIDYLYGKIKEVNVNKSSIIIEVFGIGYRVMLSKFSINCLLDKIDKSFCIYVVENTSMFNGNSCMYGFINIEDRELFQIIKTVNKIGSKGALDILSRIGNNTNEFVKYIFGNDSKSLQNMFGFTTEKADKLILGLKNKIKNLNILKDKDIISDKNLQLNFSDDAIEALKTLGYNAIKSKKIVAEILQENQNYKLEEIIKKALKKFKE